MAASLYLIATPIGNLEDITLRALRILRDEVGVIACEDTRETHKLLEHYGIRKPLISYHEHNEETRTADILRRLQAGESVALLSDAGTPLISDPGYRVVTASINAGFAVVPVPGASALLSALAASGLPASEFRFIGFLPSKAAARRRILEGIASDPATVVAYESPHRLLQTLRDISDVLGDRPIVLAREITKLYEEFLRGSAASIAEELARRNAIKGEITLVIGPGEEAVHIDDPRAEISRLEKEQGLSRMEAIKTVAKLMGLPKREIYRLSAEQGSNPRDKRRD
ncbi:MAG: 16S rRNA (cytidine(1402)-2'-O)-methyltransferase [Acidobacteriaceae bacterium]|nr:16S rRNA (cytidine(1402)-2'-O)-methyltransferase [Acidobacteriaceae bacterium]MBV9763857.1 16S rRNA (cytidine(1402)-2'-O)-methyltransferase [Acidobacteriaceae bacterium]